MRVAVPHGQRNWAFTPSGGGDMDLSSPIDSRLSQNIEVSQLGGCAVVLRFWLLLQPERILQQWYTLGNSFVGVFVTTDSAENFYQQLEVYVLQSMCKFWRRRNRPLQNYGLANFVF